MRPFDDPRDTVPGAGSGQGRGRQPDPNDGFGSGTAIDLNPPFDARLLNTGGANPVIHNRPLKRGRMIRAIGTPYRVNFMLNPTTVGVNWDNQILYDEKMVDPNVGHGFTAGDGQLSDMELLFDRTYEVWSNPTPPTTASTFGVHADILAFYAFMEMLGDSDVPLIRASSSWESTYPKSVPQQVASYLYIGDRLKFYTRITGFHVDYVHFTYEMIPIRARVILKCVVVAGADSSTTSTTDDELDPQTVMQGNVPSVVAGVPFPGLNTNPVGFGGGSP